MYLNNIGSLLPILIASCSQQSIHSKEPLTGQENCVASTTLISTKEVQGGGLKNPNNVE